MPCEAVVLLSCLALAASVVAFIMGAAAISKMEPLAANAERAKKSDLSIVEYFETALRSIRTELCGTMRESNDRLSSVIDGVMNTVGRMQDSRDLLSHKCDDLATRLMAAEAKLAQYPKHVCFGQSGQPMRKWRIRRIRAKGLFDHIQADCIEDAIRQWNEVHNVSGGALPRPELEIAEDGLWYPVDVESEAFKGLQATVTSLNHSIEQIVEDYRSLNAKSVREFSRTDDLERDIRAVADTMKGMAETLDNVDVKDEVIAGLKKLVAELEQV